MNHSADYFIKSLNMTAHPEGGYFKESFVSPSKLAPNTLHIKEERLLWTSIYFLLRTGEVFELFEREDLLEKYPKYREVIEKLTR